MSKIYYLYRHCRKDNNVPFYIGIGTKDENSMSYKRANEKRGRNKLWETYSKKYDYYIEIIFESHLKELISDKEKEFIKLYGRILDGGILCNFESGGINLFNKPPLTDIQKQNLSEKLKGRKKPPEFLKKLSNRSKGNNYNLGKTLSESTRNKISVSNKKYYDKLSEDEKLDKKMKLLEYSNKSKSKYNKTEKYENNKKLQRKKVIQFDMDYSILKEYDSISEAAFKNGLDVGKISLCCNQKRKSHGKFIWKFKEII